MQNNLNPPNTRRRALLQGSLAAPVVLTVSSSAAASITTFGKCLANHASQEADAAFFSSAPDNWFRKQVTVVQLQRGSHTGWFYFDPALNDFVDISAPGKAARIGALLEKGWEKIGEDKRWALVWVDSRTGTPYSVMQVQRPAGYTASSTTCMMSVKPGGWKK